MRITSELDRNWSSHVWRAVEILAGQKRKNLALDGWLEDSMMKGECCE
jgi:hypothetical protein